MLDDSDLALLIGVAKEAEVPYDGLAGVEAEESGFVADGNVGFECGRALARRESSGESNAICIVNDCGWSEKGDGIAI